MSGSKSWFIFALLIMGGWLIFRLAPVITPFAIAAGIAYLTDPLVDRLEVVKIGKWTFGRIFSVVLVFAVLTGLFALVILVLLPLMVRQFRELVIHFPEYLDWATGTALPWLGAKLGITISAPDSAEVTELLKQYWQELSSAALGVLETVGKGGKAIVQVLMNLALIPVVAFYLMRDWDKLLKSIQDLLPRSKVNQISSLASEIDEVLSAFIRGQLIVMIALGTIYSGGLMMIGLNGAFLIGMGAGLLSVVPYLGSIVGFGVAIGLALFQFGDLTHVALVALVFAVGQTLEGMVLTPVLVGDKIGLHPVVVIFAVLAGGVLFGFLGVLLALPAAAALNVVVRHLNDIYQHSAWYRQ